MRPCGLLVLDLLDLLRQGGLLVHHRLDRVGDHLRGGQASRPAPVDDRALRVRLERVRRVGVRGELRNLEDRARRQRRAGLQAIGLRKYVVVAAVAVDRLRERLQRVAHLHRVVLASQHAVAEAAGGVEQNHVAAIVDAGEALVVGIGVGRGDAPDHRVLQDLTVGRIGQRGGDGRPVDGAPSSHRKMSLTPLILRDL